MLHASRIQELLAPYAVDLSREALEGIASYVDLLMRWNTRTNLTAIRDETTLIQRQVGESLFAARFLSAGASLLDFGSGAGFPGIPLLLIDRDRAITLAESQGKKASFLREALRKLNLRAEVWAGRVEAMPAERVFDCVVMRAVDHTDSMLPLAEARLSASGFLLRYLSAEESTEMPGWNLVRTEPVPCSAGRLVQWRKRV